MVQKANFDSKMLEMRQAIKESLKSQEIMDLVKQYGYTKDRLEGFDADYEEIYELDQKQKKETGIQLESSKKLDDLYIVFEESYMDFIKVSRAIFKDKDSAYISLGLRGERKKSMSGIINQAKTFYTAALKDNEILNMFIAKGISKENLEEGYKHLNDLLDEYYFHNKEMEDKKVLTKKRDEKFDTLVEEMSEYKTFALFALKGRQDLKNKLGW